MAVRLLSHSSLFLHSGPKLLKEGEVKCSAVSSDRIKIIGGLEEVKVASLY